MATTLRDGTVIPSGMRATPLDQVGNQRKFLLANHSLKEGTVIDSYPPSHPRNRSGHWEYDVEVYEFEDSTGITSPVIYYHCRVMTLFGSMADRTSFTLRQSEGRENEQADKAGANVLLLCVNGSPHQTYIIGSAPHLALSAPIEEHHYLFSFNGVEFFINEAGEVILSQSGPKNLQGSPDGEQVRTTISLNKDGRIEVSDGRGQEVVLEEGKVTIRATDEVFVNAQEINLGNDRSPVLRATKSYEKAVHDLNSQLKAVCADLKQLCMGISSEPTLSSSKAPASKMMVTLQALELMIDQYDQTVSTDDAISKKTFSE